MQLTSGNSNVSNSDQSRDLYVQSINRLTGFVEFTSEYTLAYFTPIQNELILSPKNKYRMRSERGITKLIFTGVPIYMKPDIVFLDGKLV